MKRYAWIAMKLQAIENCFKTDNNEWFNRHSDELESDLKETAPSGSGFDNGTELDYTKSRKKKIETGSISHLVFNTAFHHMNEDGYYTRWTYHTVIVTPTFEGINIRVTGRDHNMIKDYIADVFGQWLNIEVKD